MSSAGARSLSDAHRKGDAERPLSVTSMFVLVKVAQVNLGFVNMSPVLLRDPMKVLFVMGFTAGKQNKEMCAALRVASSSREEVQLNRSIKINVKQRF